MCVDYWLPRPPPLLPSACAHNNTRERKTGKKKNTGKAWEHWSHEICEVDVGWVEGPNCQNNARDSLSKPSTTVSNSRPQHNQNYLSWLVRNLLSSLVHIYLSISPSTPYVHLVSTRVVNAPREGIYFFTGLLLPCIIVNANGGNNGGGLGTRLQTALTAYGTPYQENLTATIYHILCCHSSYSWQNIGKMNVLSVRWPAHSTNLEAAISRYLGIWYHVMR